MSVGIFTAGRSAAFDRAGTTGSAARKARRFIGGSGCLIRDTLGENLAIRRAGLVVSLRGRGAFRLADPRQLLLPALVDRLEAPVGRALAGADRFPVHENEDGIGMARRQD